VKFLTTSILKKLNLTKRILEKKKEKNEKVQKNKKVIEKNEKKKRMHCRYCCNPQCIFKLFFT
jgi:hypothetical protein